MPWEAINAQFVEYGILGALLLLAGFVIWRLLKEYQKQSDRAYADVRACDAERILDAHKLLPVIQGNSEALDGITDAMEARNRLIDALTQSFSLNAQKLENLERTTTTETARFREQLNRIEESLKQRG